MGTSASAQLKCSNCGLAFSEFTRTGFLGCGECYKQFNDELRPIYKRIHGDYEHKGKVPVARRQSTCHCKIDRLRKEPRNVWQGRLRAAELWTGSGIAGRAGIL